jgi:3-oxoacyl-[acyl-carrier protein] reductase
MGAHFARRLHEAGAQVAAGDVDEKALEELPAGIHRRKLDVASEAEVGDFVEWAHGAMGGLNGLVNNAGILRDGLLVKKDGRPAPSPSCPATVERGHRREPHGRDADGPRGRREDGETGTRPGVIVNMSSIARYGNRGQSNYSRRRPRSRPTPRRGPGSSRSSASAWAPSPPG